MFQSRKYEVLFLFDAWDEFVMDHLHDFEGKDVKAAEKADINLADTEKKEGALSDDEAKDLATWMKTVLGDRVGEVRSSQRLVESPAVLMDSDKYMTASMRRMLKAMKREDDSQMQFKHDLELNPRHGLITRLHHMRQTDAALAGKVAEQVLDNARVSAGLMDDPRMMLKRMNELLEQVLTAKS